MQIVEVVLPVAVLLETAGCAKQKSQKTAKDQRLDWWIIGFRVTPRARELGTFCVVDSSEPWMGFSDLAKYWVMAVQAEQ
jgi:hypothetical protein